MVKQFDIIELNNYGNTYPSYVDIFDVAIREGREIFREYKKRWKSGEDPKCTIEDPRWYRILNRTKHLRNRLTTLYIIEDIETKQVYINSLRSKTYWNFVCRGEDWAEMEKVY